jgi:uncharacterized cupredoxin-like copper-binding protein
MKPTRVHTVAAVLAVALLGAAVAGVVAHASARTTTIKVTEREFRIALSARKVHAGPTQLVVHNTGRYPHALAIAGPGVKTKKTPTIRPGKTARLRVTLAAGTYTVWCPIPGHAARGMKARLVATGAAAARAATTTAGTTTSGGGGGEAWG